jgi:superfamily II DNA or RNA helicase
VVSPTGSGKTVIFAHIATGAVKKGKRVLILTHRREILQQTVSKIASYGIQAGEIIAGKKTTDELIQVAMVGTLINRLSDIPDQDLIIIDECQHSVSNTWSKVIQHFSCLRLGYTATPERLSGEGLNEIFDTMVLGPHTIDLVNSGFLSPPRVYCGPNIQEKPKLKVTRGDYDKKEQTNKMLKKVVIGSVIEHYREKINGLPAVCFCVSIDHCYQMEADFIAAGFRARTITGKMSRSDRDEVINGLSTGTVQVLCSCDVISEGVDVPVLAGCILLRRTKSLALYLQQVGRALRPYPGKKEAVILDHCGNFYEHGHPLDIREWSLEAKKRSQRGQLPRPEVSVCPKCSGVWPGTPALCPECGHNLQEDRDRAAGRKPPREIEGILKEVMPAGTDLAPIVQQVICLQNKTPGERQKAMISNIYREGNTARVRGLASALGYKPGWTGFMCGKLRGRR